MAKITRPLLSRGIKLEREHVYTPASSAASALAAHIDATQIKNARAAFRLNFYIPMLDELPFRPIASDAIPPDYRWSFTPAIPFTLPPTQDFFDPTGVQSTATPEFILDEMSVSFDSRAEAGSIRGPYVGYGDNTYDTAPGNDAGAGNLVAGTTRLDLTIALYEKTPNYWQASGDESFQPERSVLSFAIPGLSLVSTEARENPFVFAGLNRRLDAYKTYILTINCPGLYDRNAALADKIGLCLPSLHVSMRCLGLLQPRDTWSGSGSVTTLQNAPRNEINQVAAVVSVAIPAADSVIRADAGGGVQTNIQAIDAAFQAKLRGGLDRESQAPASEHLQVDSAYEVIAVPLFNSLWPMRKLDADLPLGGGANPLVGDYETMPYISPNIWGGLPNDKDVFADRRVLRLTHPFIVHHVIAAQSYVTPYLNETNAAAPQLRSGGSVVVGVMPGWARTDLVTKVGVAIGSGLRGNRVGYQQVAYATWDPTTRNNFIIDRINARFARVTGVGYSSTALRDYELLNVPLVGGASNAGTGYGGAGLNKQGRPFYCGRSTTMTADRADCYRIQSASWGNSIVGGAEQFIEVRWTMQDAVAGLATGTREVYIGYGGCWIFIIGKRCLADE